MIGRLVLLLVGAQAIQRHHHRRPVKGVTFV